MSACDTSISIKVLDQTEVPYHSTAWGMNEISICSRGLMIDCTLCAMCPGCGLFGPTSAKYWSAVNTLRTCLSPGFISTCKTMDITLILILTVAWALTWKLHAESDDHHPWSCLQHQNHTIIVTMYQRWSASLMHWSSCLKLGSVIF